jgi:ubiquitin-activating enzyme E1 C
MEGQHVDIENLIGRSGPFAQDGFKPDSENDRSLRQFLLKDCRVLVIGAGGLGCELLKDLGLVGFTNIEVIDMDTIDISNLNRQFLFRPADVGKSKAEVASKFVNTRIPGVNVVAHCAKIQDFDEEFYQQFHVVVAGLDSIKARRWLNQMLVSLVGKKTDEDGDELEEWDDSTVIPLIDGGTEGFKGQARVIFPHRTPCFECLLDLFPEDPLNFPMCTVAVTPRQPEHCIAWAMMFAWPKEKGQDAKIDGDDPDHISWLFQKAEGRAKEFNITGVTYKLTQGVVKRIIPAIASTNAVIAAACANEAFKIATQSSQYLKNYMMYNGGEGLYTSTVNYDKNPECLVCGTTGVPIHFNRDGTLQELIDYLKNDTTKFDAIKDPSLLRLTDEGSDKLYMTGFLAPKLKPNLTKKLHELVEDGDTLTITDRTDRNINYVVKIHLTNAPEVKEAPVDA